MMDPSIGWFQDEHKGPALDLWQVVWHQSSPIERQPDFMPIEDNTESNNTLNNMRSPNKRFRKDNPASTYDLNGNAQLMAKHGGMPWRQLRQHYEPGIIGLHQEIDDFYEYMKPKPEEHFMRADVVKRITKVVSDVWPQAKVDYFGSFRTGLYLPTSDIDMVVVGMWETIPLFTLEKKLLESGIVDETTIRVLDKASVPIIKLTDLKTDVKVDISFNTSNGIKSAKLIKQFKKEFPNLKKLIFVLKYFLLERDLKEVFTGGISSYCLILMTISFLQLHPRLDIHDPNANLGVLLLEFLELYGCLFNYYRVGIRINGSGSYVTKAEIQKQLDPDNRPSILCIEDPFNPKNDIGKSSYGYLRVKIAFEYAYHTLHQAVGPLSATVDPKKTILGRIIRVTDEVVDYRLDVCKRFPIPKKNSIASNHSMNDSDEPSTSSSCSPSSDDSDNETESHSNLRRNSPTNTQRNNYNNSQNHSNHTNQMTGNQLRNNREVYKPQNYSKNRNQSSFSNNRFANRNYSQTSRQKYRFTNNRKDGI